jgi:fatty acid desaturase
MSVQGGNGSVGGDGAERRPIGQILTSVIGGFGILARKHVELAKIEAAEAVSVRGKGAGMMAGAAVVAMYAIGFMFAAGAAALALVVPVWAAILIVAVLMFLVAWVLVVLGRRTIKSAPAPVERTQEALKEDMRWAKQQIKR